MDKMKEDLVERYGDGPGTKVHAGYHRGRRPMIGDISYPDIISVHLLHLHLIIEPRPGLTNLKYPSWNRWMWISDKRVLEKIQKQSQKASLTE